MSKNEIIQLNEGFPTNIKGMSLAELQMLADDIRRFLVSKVSKTGGHLASSLGVTELTIAMHYVFDSPEDKFIWDVGHQSYVHKILTGRASGFDSLRQLDGMSGFPKRSESPHDVFDTGHSSNSISVASGMAAARDLKGESYDVVAVIGDGALTGGMAYEGLDSLGSMTKNKTIIILNDNNMSISRNKGGMSNHLSQLRVSDRYLEAKKDIRKILGKIPGVGGSMVAGLTGIKKTFKYALVDGVIFEEMGFTYMGPVNGHDFNDLIKNLSAAKNTENSVIVHVITEKGKGYEFAEKAPDKFHGIGPFDPETGEVKSSSSTSFSDVFGRKLTDMALKDDRICAVSAAMTTGTGLDVFNNLLPERSFDAGIAEQHAVTFSAGLANNGMRPFAAIYSTFLQRAYDQILEDVCLQKLPVVLGIDRAGIVGADGETHHGIFDLSYLSHMPGMTILAPADSIQLEEMMEYAVTLDGPCAIRYPRGKATENIRALIPETWPDLSDQTAPAYDAEAEAAANNDTEFCPSGKTGYDPDTETAGCSDENINKKAGNVNSFGVFRASVLKEGTDLEIWAEGSMVKHAVEAAAILCSSGIDAGVVNASSIKPLDSEALKASVSRTRMIVTVEDNVETGGFGDMISHVLRNEYGSIPVHVIGWPVRFIEHGSTDELYARYRLDGKGIAERIRELI